MSASYRVVPVPRFVRRYGEESVAAEGFLPDPDDSLGPYRDRNALRFEEVFEGPCTVILGEPGLGKTTALETRVRALPAGAVHWRRPWPASAYASPEFDAWRYGRDALHLTIDGIDEATSATYVDELLVFLESGPVDCIRLELAGRAAEWPPILDQGLRRIFGDAYRSFLLEPLRVADAIVIAEGNGVDGGAFLSEVRERGLEPLASRPLTLQMLLSLSREGPLPTDVADLYRRACEKLCQEHNEVRQARRGGGGPTVGDQLEVAEWLAAGMMFSGFRTVSRTAQPGDGGRLGVDTLVDGLPGHDRSTVEHLLDSSLFTMDADGDRGWTHLSFAEYLAARWLGRLPTKQQRQLMSHQAADPEHVPRALWGVASWLCRLDRDSASWFACAFPEVLLLASSRSLAPPAALETATEALLSRSGQIPGLHPWWPHTRLRNLSHPRLGKQLGAVLTDGSRADLQRRVAIDIARANKTPDALDSLVDAALDPTRPAGERAAAIRAAWLIGTGDENRRTLAGRLRPLVEQDRDAKSDDIKTALIERMWPDHLTTDELLVLLAPPRRNLVLNSYVSALRKVASNLPGAALPATLRWLAERPGGWWNGIDPSFEMRGFAVEVIEGGLSRLGEPEVAVAMGHAVGELAEANTRVLDLERHSAADWRNDPRRLKLVEAVVAHSRSWDEGYRLFRPYKSPRLLFEDEYPWIVAKHRAAVGDGRQRWASLIRHVVSFTRSFHSDDVPFIEDLVEQTLEGEHVLPWPLFESLDGERARALKKARALEEQVRDDDAAREARREADRLPLQETARRVLGGESPLWTTCVLQHAGRAGEAARFDAERALGLTNASPSLVDLVLRASRSFLREIDLNPEDWLGVENARCWRVEVGVMLLVTVHERDPNWLERQSVGFWEKWTPAIIDLFDSLEYLEDARALPRYERLLGLCWSTAPRVVGRELASLLEHGYVPNNLIGFVALPSSDELDDILERALASSGSNRFSASIASVLLARDPDRVAGIAALHLHPATPHPHADDLVDAMLAIGSLEAWTLVWRRGGYLAAKIASSIASTHPDSRRDELLPRLPEPMLADLYRWTVDHHPDVRDDDYRSDMPRLRHAIGAALSARGTDSAVALLQVLRERYPQREDLDRRVAEAEHHRLEATWQRAPLDALFAMPSRADLHMVRSAGELLDAVCDALELYQERLHGSSNEVDALWSDDGGRQPTYWPKNEVTLSKHVANRLQDLLSASVYNEVEVKPRSGDVPGERCDILVTTRAGSIVHRVVIEAKCQWNKDLMTSLGAQLVDRYLGSLPGTYGVYLVGWFHSSRAAPTARPKLRQWSNRRALSAALSEQAAQASTSNRRVKYVAIDASLEGTYEETN
jgi:hypothetical protein